MILDDPFLGSLTTDHSHLAIGNDLVKRYPPEIAPFAGLVEQSAAAEAAMCELFLSGEKACHVGRRFEGPEWELIRHFYLLQFVYAGEEPESQDSRLVALSDGDIGAMLELTALVYPAYFRAETAKLGPYFGMWDGDRLVAMAGMRMSMPGWKEISAVCVHPDFRGQGLAKALLAKLVSEIHALGCEAFLHTEHDNPGQHLYSKCGFVVRERIPFWVLNRV